MKRVASLYLPNWPIDRLRRIERRHAPSAEVETRAAHSPSLEVRFDTLGNQAAAERAKQCSVPKEGGWRPGARWAKTNARTDRAAVEAAVASLPQHQRPPQRELGRISEGADNPFRQSAKYTGLSHPPEERVASPAPLRELSRRTEAATHPFRPGTQGWSGADMQDALDGLPPHQRPKAKQLLRGSEIVDNPFARPVSATRMPPLQFPGEDAPNKAGRGAALRKEDDGNGKRGQPVRKDASVPSRGRSRRPTSRDGHNGEAGFIAPPSLAQLAAMPAIQYPGEGPHPDNHGKSAPTAPTYGKGRFFQTGRTLGSVVARVCPEGEAQAGTEPPAAKPPLVTTHKKGSRVELAAVCPAARALGLHPGMALTMARAQIPQLDARPADAQGDAADLAKLADLLARRWSPIVAISDDNGIFIDLTGVAHLHGGEQRFCRRLVRLLERHGITARVAVADSAGAAWALARYGKSKTVRIVEPDAHKAALSPLPPAALRLEPASLELLSRLGVDTIGQLLAMPRAPLVRRFSKAIADRLDQAMGRAPEPLLPVVPAEAIVVEQRFAEPIATADAIEHWLRELAPRLAHALAEAGLGARSIELLAARIDGIPQRLHIGFAKATREPSHMLRLMLRRIEEVEPGYGIDALALHVRRAEPLGAEELGAVLAGETKPDLAMLIDNLVNRIGTNRLWRTVPVESDVPERSLCRVAPLDTGSSTMRSLKQDDVRRLDNRSPDHPWHQRWPRPVRLLRRPERLQHVMAEMPDQPPRRFTWRGQTFKVVRAEGPERITGEWWRRTDECRAVRDYFQVEDEEGRRFWLYRRGDGVRVETGDLTWYLHGRYC